MMSQCDVCGNEYAHAFEVRTPDGAAYVFDSLECAAHRIAPICAHCGCRILGHGVENASQVFCCAACARQVDAQPVRA